MVDIGLVQKAVGGNFYVLNNQKVYECRASRKLTLKKNQILPGDIVEFDVCSSYITEIKKRKNELIRPKIANITTSLLVFSCVEPKFSFFLLDKMILTMMYNNLKIIILLTKEDLITGEGLEELILKLKYYKKLNLRIILKTEVLQQSDKLNREKFKYFNFTPGEKILTTGQSGVGKSTFLNELLDVNLKTNEISKNLGRGKHTTRESTFYNLNTNKNIEKTVFLIDTPGFSSLELQLTKEEIRDTYRDFKELSKACKFNNCYHINEPGCMVKKMYCEKKLLKSRYENYIKFMEEV